MKGKGVGSPIEVYYVIASSWSSLFDYFCNHPLFPITVNFGSLLKTYDFVRGFFLSCTFI